MGRVTNACFRTSERGGSSSRSPSSFQEDDRVLAVPFCFVLGASLMVPNSLVFPSIGLGPNYLVWYNENVEVGRLIRKACNGERQGLERAM